MLQTDFKYLDPISLIFDKSDPQSFGKSLRKQLRESLQIHKTVKKAVYVIRMTGSFIIAYKNGNSPVLYVGCGNARGRVLTHIGRWIKDVSDFGKDTQVEIRILLPRRQNREKFYKNVEADLLKDFRAKYNCLPYFNGRLESGYAGRVRYNTTQMRRMRALIGVGSGRRPWWAIKPTRANHTQAKYLKGTPSS